MPRKSPSQKIDELAEKVRQLDAAFDRHWALAELRLQTLEAHNAERARKEEEARNKMAELAAKTATLEERSRSQEKTTDRGWQLWIAILGFLLGLISLLTTAVLQIKK